MWLLIEGGSPPDLLITREVFKKDFKFRNVTLRLTLLYVFDAIWVSVDEESWEDLLITREAIQMKT